MTVLDIKKKFIAASIIIILFLSINISKSTINKLNDFTQISMDLSDSSIWIQEIGDSSASIAGGFGGPNNFATRAMEIFNGELYIGTQSIFIDMFPPILLKLLVTSLVFQYKLLYNTSFSKLSWQLLSSMIPLYGVFNKGCEVWKYNNSEAKWSPIVSNAPGSILSAGFGSKRNFAASVIISFNGKLYMGNAGSTLFGCEIWEFDGQQFEKVVKGGFGDRFNSGAWSATVFNDELYVGTMNWKHGCQIWKTIDGENWEEMPLPGRDGFGTRWNVYLWSFGIYNDLLYAGTVNLNGCQLWSYDGQQWIKVDLPGGDGFGEHENYGIRNIVEFNGELWFAIATNALLDSEACEIWKYDGEIWTQVIGDSCYLGDGFDDIYNKYAWSMIPKSDNSLWVGTMSIQMLDGALPGASKGCEIWRYNGISWKEIVGESKSSEATNGFGNNLNLGARSMIEYPENSGIIWVGTFNLDVKDFKTFKGCEVWKRTVIQAD